MGTAGDMSNILEGGGSVGGGGTPATGATAGTPGAWTPPGSTPPATAQSMGGSPARPTPPWTWGQYVQTGTAGAAGQVSWNGSAWAVGPATFSASAHTVAEVQDYVTANPTERDR